MAGLLIVRNGRNGRSVATHVRKADTIPTRVRGLLGKSELADGEGLLIEPCSGVHTWFMRFPIDVAFLSKEGQVLRVKAPMLPFRTAAFVRGAHSVLELPAGALGRADVRDGDVLKFERGEDRAA